MDKFDLIIIGGGGAGFAAATRATEMGAEAVIINGGLASRRHLRQRGLRAL